MLPASNDLSSSARLSFVSAQCCVFCYFGIQSRPALSIETFFPCFLPSFFFVESAAFVHLAVVAKMPAAGWVCWFFFLICCVCTLDPSFNIHWMYMADDNLMKNCNPNYETICEFAQRLKLNAPWWINLNLWKKFALKIPRLTQCVQKVRNSARTEKKCWSENKFFYNLINS